MEYNSNTEILGIKPERGRSEPLYNESKILDKVAENLIINESKMFQEKAKDTTIDYKKAAEILDRNNEIYKKAYKDFNDVTIELSENIKKTSANLRISAEKLSQGIIKCQKTADFNTLERYVALLERAATALTILGDLEKNGKLEKISKALK